MDIKVFVWTINDEIEYQKMQELEIDGVITDHHAIFLGSNHLK
jgi:glycerophosphoryl diester phosphodiesterase